MTNPISTELREKDVPLMQSGAFKDTRAVIRKAADHIDAQEAKIKALVEVLERNWREDHWRGVSIDAADEINAALASARSAISAMSEPNTAGLARLMTVEQMAAVIAAADGVKINRCAGSTRFRYEQMARAALAAVKEPT